MRLVLLLIFTILVGCASQAKKTPDQAQSQSNAEELVKMAYASLEKRDTRTAIGHLDKAIELCQYQYDSKDQKYYAARTVTDTLFYMATAAKNKQQASAVKPLCADALYFKAYASIDLGNIEDAKDYLKRAIDMAPANAMYLSELGHVYQTNRGWNAALETFSSAEKMADSFSPPELKKAELLRAKRGVGFSLTELGKLDEAESKFKECLELDPSDQKSANEIKYINQLRSSKIPPNKTFINYK